MKCLVYIRIMRKKVVNTRLTVIPTIAPDTSVAWFSKSAKTPGGGCAAGVRIYVASWSGETPWKAIGSEIGRRWYEERLVQYMERITKTGRDREKRLHIERKFGENRQLRCIN